MINVFEVRETNKMIEESNLDVRTITMGISLLDCCDNNVDVVCEKIYRKITEKAANLVKVGEQIELDYGIPIVNKRISVTPIALVGGSCCKTPEDYVKIAKNYQSMHIRDLIFVSLEMKRAFVVNVRYIATKRI